MVLIIIIDLKTHSNEEWSVTKLTVKFMLRLDMLNFCN